VDQARLRFEKYLKRRFGQSTTPKCYISDLTIFARTIGDKAPAAITATDVDTFVDEQIAAGLKPTTINRRLASIRSFFEYLASESPEIHWPNPVVWQRHQLKTGSRLPRDVPDRDVTRLFAVITDERDQAMFGLMVGAGLRVGEVTTLRMHDLVEPSERGGLAKVRVCGKGNKERIAWLTPSLWETLCAWLRVRPLAETNRLFLNHRGLPISVAGIQYRLKNHCQKAGLALTCHQLRHTFGRRLSESGLAVESLAKLLGHSQLHTTQRYIDGADLTVRADFMAAMVHLEEVLASEHEPTSILPDPRSFPRPEPMPTYAELLKLRQQLKAAALPPWLHDAVDAYLSWRWPTWHAQTAYQLGRNFMGVVRRVWAWLDEHRHIGSWEGFRRADLQAWLEARCQTGVSTITIRGELGQMHGFLKFMEARGCPLDPGLFRVQAPKSGTLPLPRYLSEPEYRRLETTLLKATQTNSYSACFDRAWFLTLAHTGLRISELLSLHLDDVDLDAGRAVVRGGKPGNDRVVYLSPTLIDALGRYLAHRPDLPDEGRVFVLRGRSPSPRTIQRRLARYGQQAEVHVTPHKLRHTLATRLINQGMSIHSLQKLLGHQQLETTQIYARIYDKTLYEQFKTAINRLEAIAIEDWPRPEPIQTELAEIGLTWRADSPSERIKERLSAVRSP
jgi:integrase/recombinase XerC